MTLGHSSDTKHKLSRRLKEVLYVRVRLLGLSVTLGRSSDTKHKLSRRLKEVLYVRVRLLGLSVTLGHSTDTTQTVTWTDGGAVCPRQTPRAKCDIGSLDRHTTQSTLSRGLKEMLYVRVRLLGLM